MATIQYKINGSFLPFFVELRENDENGNLIDTDIVQSASTVVEFTNVDVGDYVIVTYDTAEGTDISPIINVTP